MPLDEYNKLVDNYREAVRLVGEGNVFQVEAKAYKAQHLADSIYIEALRKDSAQSAAVIAAQQQQVRLADAATANITSQMRSLNDIINVQKGTITKLANRPPKRFGIGAFVGYGTSMNKISLGPIAGVGLQYNLIRF